MKQIITISREFGSGGRELGKRLADNLGFAYFDKEIVSEIAKETGFDEKYISGVLSKSLHPISISYARSFSAYSNINKNKTEILVVQQKILSKIASQNKGNAVIIGMGTDEILKDCNPLNIFVYADINSKINRCKEREKDNDVLSEKEIKSKIKSIDENRKKSYNIVSNGKEWGKKENYHLCVNTSKLEIKNIIPALAKFVNAWFEQ